MNLHWARSEEEAIQMKVETWCERGENALVLPMRQKLCLALDKRYFT